MAGGRGGARSGATVFVDADEDRWRWRARLKRNPTTRRIYRGAIGTVGTVLILLGVATGWLPGPGGIPLTLVGLAVLASEFDWADRLLQWAKDRLRDWGRWVAGKPPWFRWLGGIATAVCVVAAFWVGFRVMGVPTWLPGDLDQWLTLHVPGLP